MLGRSTAKNFLLASHAEVSALRLAKDVVGGSHTPRSPATETTQPAVHQPGIDLFQLPVSNTPAVESARAVVLHHDVRLGGQLFHDRLPFRSVEIHRDEVLVGVGTQEAEPGTALWHPLGERVEERLVERRGMPHRLATLGGLDLDYLRTQLS